jgi:hypothetical protein
MSQAASESLGIRVLARVSWLKPNFRCADGCCGSVLPSGINAEYFGAREMAVALGFAFVVAVASVGALCAAPILRVLRFFSLFLQRRTGFTFLAAGAVTALPLAVPTWLGGG